MAFCSEQSSGSSVIFITLPAFEVICKGSSSQELLQTATVNYPLLLRQVIKLSSSPVLNISFLRKISPSISLT